MSDFKRLKIDHNFLPYAASQSEIDAAANLRSLKKVQAPGLDKLLLAIEMSEEIATTALSRNSSVTSFFSATSSPTLSRQSSISISDDVQKGISQLTEKDLLAIRLKLKERNELCVLAEKDPVLAEKDAVLAEIDDLIDKLLQNGKNGCILISKILNRLFQIFKCGIGAAIKIFESKLYFRLFLIISLIGYSSNDTCAAAINVTGAAIFNIMDFILSKASPENYAKLQAIFTSINNVVQFIGAAFGLISEKGMAMIECLRIMMDLMEGASTESIKHAIDGMKVLMEEINMSAKDIADILATVKSLGLSGEQMTHILLSIMKILTEMQIAPVPARDVTTTILKHLTDSLSGVASQAAITAIAAAMSNVPRIGNGGGKRKKATRKNKKKTVNKRRKQQRKSKRM